MPELLAMLHKKSKAPIPALLFCVSWMNILTLTELTVHIKGQNSRRFLELSGYWNQKGLNSHFENSRKKKKVVLDFFDIFWFFRKDLNDFFDWFTPRKKFKLTKDYSSIHKKSFPFAVFHIGYHDLAGIFQLWDTDPLL